MVSVKQCVLIFLLSLCISSSIVVDSRRVRKHRRRDSRNKHSRGITKRYPYEETKTSRFDDCVDCGNRFYEEEDDYDRQNRNRKQRFNVRKRKKDKKEDSKKESSYSLWNLFNFWSDDDSDEEKETKEVTRRKHRQRGRRKWNKNTQSRKSYPDDRKTYPDDRHWENSGRNRAPISRDRLSQFQNVPKAKRQHQAGTGRRRKNGKSQNGDSGYGGRRANHNKRRKGRKGQHQNRRKKVHDRQNGRGDYQRAKDNDRKELERISKDRLKISSGVENKQRKGHHGGKGNGEGRRKSQKFEDVQKFKKAEKLKYGKRNKNEGQQRETNPKNEEENVSGNTQKLYAHKSKLKNHRKTDGSDSYPLVKAELQQLGKLEKIKRKKSRKGKKQDFDTNEPSSALKIPVRKSRLRNSEEDEESDKRVMIRKGHRKGKKRMKGQGGMKKTNKQTSHNSKMSGRVPSFMKGTAKKSSKKTSEKNSLSKEKGTGKKASNDENENRQKNSGNKKRRRRKKKPKAEKEENGKHSEGKGKGKKIHRKEKGKKVENEKGKRKLKKDMKKDSEEETDKEKKEDSLPGSKKRKHNLKKKKKTSKTTDDESVTQQNNESGSEESSKKKNSKNKSDKENSGNEKKNSNPSDKEISKTGKKKSKKSRGDIQSSSKSSVNKAFNIFIRAQKFAQENDKPNESGAKTEAQKQVEALTDEQLQYAIRVAEKRFKRNDKRIKIRLTALKEKVARHLDKLDTLEMSMDQRYKPVRSNPMANKMFSNSTLMPMNKIAAFQYNRRIPSRKVSSDFRKNAKSFLQYASRLSLSAGTSPRAHGQIFRKEPTESQVSGEDSAESSRTEERKKPKVENPFSNLAKLFSNNQENTDSRSRESLEVGLKHDSKKKSGRKRKKQKETQSTSSLDKETDRDESSSGNNPDRKDGRLSDRDRQRQTSERQSSDRDRQSSDTDRQRQSSDRDRQRQRLDRKRQRQIAERERQQKIAERERQHQIAERERQQQIAERERERQRSDTDRQRQKSDRDRQRQQTRQRNSQSSSRNRGRPQSIFQSGPQKGRSDGRRNNGFSRNEKFQFIRDRANYRQMQRALPRLTRSIRDIKRRLRHVLQPFETNMKLSDMYYQQVFNITRNDIIKGAREILESVNNANDVVYDAVLTSSTLARSIYKKAHHLRAAHRPGVLSEEAYQRAVESKVKQKNFRPQMEKVQQQQQSLRASSRDMEMIEMKSRQLESRFVQVHERFLDKYDYEAFRDLFSNMRGTIDILNNGLHPSYPLRKLHQSKQRVKSMQREVTSARDLLHNSSSVYRNGMMKLRENEELVWRVKRGRRDLRSKRMVADSPGPSLTSQQYTMLDRLTRKARQHAQQLNKEMFQIQRVLETSINHAQRALERARRNHVTRHPVEAILVGLKTVQEEAVISLDALRRFIGSRNEITLARLRGCKSGHLDTDDEDLDCVIEGSGVEGSADYDVTFVDSEDDFTFDRSGETKPASRLTPLQAFGKDLKAFTSDTLKTSQILFDKCQDVHKSLEGLKRKWDDHGGDANMPGRELFLRQRISNGILAWEKNSTKIREQIKQINQKIKEVNEVDFDELHAKAETAIELIEERKNNKEEEEVNDQPEEGIEVDELTMSDLVKKGQTISAHRDSIKELQTFAMNMLDKSNNSLNRLRGNITQLWHKVKVAKNLLNSMKLSILKEGESPIVSTALSDDLKSAKSVTTSLSLCVKPQSLDGTVLYSAGNNSISYALKLSDGELTASVYDKDNTEISDVTLDEKLEQDQWHTISLLRVGQTLNLTATTGGKAVTESVEVESLPEHQMAPALSYIGGMPEKAKMNGDEPWEGCVSEFLINGKAMSLFGPKVDGNSPTLCSDHCVSRGRKLSWIFDGNGFVLYDWDPRESLQSLTLQFRSKQSHAAILSASNKRRGFNLLVTLKDGAIQIESSTRMENVVLLSLNNSLNDGNTHTLQIKYRDRGMYPELDGNASAFSVENSDPKMLNNVRSGILIGAFVSVEKFISDLHRPLIGCASVTSINGKPLMYDRISQSHNVYYGRCTMGSLWQSCVHFPESSQSLLLEELDDSNKISMQLLRNSTGPLLFYAKDGDFEIELMLTEDGIDVSSDDSEGVLIRPEDFQPNNAFDLVTVVDEGDQVVVSAFGESTKISYGGWLATADLTKPHTVGIGETRDGEERLYAVSISEFVIGQRVYDLTKHSSSHTIKTCEVPENYLQKNFPVNENVSNS